MSRILKSWITILFLTSIALDVPEFIAAFRDGPDWSFFFVGNIVFGILGLGAITTIWTSQKLKLVTPTLELAPNPRG